MDSFFDLLVIVGVVSAVGGVLFWGAVAYFGIRAVKNLNSGGVRTAQSGLVGFDPNFAMAVQNIQKLVAQAQATRAQEHGTPGGPFVPNHLQRQFDAQIWRAQQQLQAFDGLNRQRHETMVSGMLSDASAAGIDVSSWRL